MSHSFNKYFLTPYYIGRAGQTQSFMAKTDELWVFQDVLSLKTILAPNDNGDNFTLNSSSIGENPR